MTTNMSKADYLKSLSLLHIFERLQRGEVIRTKEEMERFNVSRKTIQRYIGSLREYLAEFSTYDFSAKIIYDQKKQGYVLIREEDSWLSKKEILVLAKVLLESRAFTNGEMDDLLDKLILQAEPEKQEQITEVISNERFHYTPVKHNQSLIEIIWDLSESVRKQQVVEITYKSLNKSQPTKYRVKPVSIIFSDFYFYLIAYMCDRDFDHPTVFRVDRINNYTEDDENFNMPYLERFKPGEFRKRVQFMFNGELSRIKFKYYSKNIEHILDRLPTAEVIEETEDGYIIKAEVYSEFGLRIWLLSQGKSIEVLKPESLRQQMEELIEGMLEVYR